MWSDVSPLLTSTQTFSPGMPLILTRPCSCSIGVGSIDVLGLLGVVGEEASKGVVLAHGLGDEGEGRWREEGKK